MLFSFVFSELKAVQHTKSKETKATLQVVAASKKSLVTTQESGGGRGGGSGGGHLGTGNHDGE